MTNEHILRMARSITALTYGDLTAMAEGLTMTFTDTEGCDPTNPPELAGLLHAWAVGTIEMAEEDAQDALAREMGRAA